MHAISRAATAACAIFLAGCAFSPPSFRVVAVANAPERNPLKALEVLPPGVQRVDVGEGRRYLLDIPLDTPAWRCPTLEVGDSRVGLSARVITAGFDAAILRVSMSARPSSAELRKAWRDWNDTPASKAITACFSETDHQALPDRLEASRPVDGEESLEAAFGRPGVVLLKPGMTVCGSDAFMRNASATANVSTGALCARVARSPKGGAVLDPMRYTLGNITSGATDEAVSRVHRIASWAEVPRGAHAVQYLVRYPTRLPKASEEIHAVNVSLLISLGSGIEPQVRQAAMQCIAREDKLKYFCPEKPANDADDCKTLREQLNPKPQCYRFGERGVMDVTIPVLVNGIRSDIEVGALVGDAATRLGRSHATPPATMMRWHHGRLHAVEFELKDKAFDLPMLPGDQLSW